MRNLLLNVLAFFAFTFTTSAQNTFTFNCQRDTSINCVQACMILKTRIPDIRSSTSSYAVNQTSGANGCFRQYISPSTAGTSANLTIDDKYSSVISIGFPFPFFGTTFTQLVASTNGYLSFDITKATLFSHFGILNNSGALSATTGTPQNLPSTLYDKGLIMGPYHDLDPAYTTSPTKMIKYDLVGTAPYRRWILSFYKVPLYYSINNCDQLIENTHQVVLYESLGIVEGFINDKQICTGWNQGRAMIGMQNMNRDAGIMAPARKASDAPWGSIGMNESWRFVPASGPSLLQEVTLYDLAGNIISFGDTASNGNNVLDVNFQNVCPPLANGITSYIVKSKYKSILDPTIFIFGTDTIRVARNSGITASTNTVDASCSNGNTGTITVNVTSGVGPFEYSINNGVTYQSSNVFTAPPGTYTILIRKVGTTCPLSISATITTTATTITATAVTTIANCSNGNIGAITISVTSGVGPFEYSIDNGLTYQSSNVFNRPAGNYTIIVRKTGTTCTGTVNATITAGPSAITASYFVTPVKCNGGSDGTITINAAQGSPPYQYSSNGGTTFQVSNIFNLPQGTYAVRIKDGIGCTKDTTINITQPASLSLSATTINATCSPTPDGIITATAGGGVSLFTYSINGTTFQVSNQFSVIPGTYTVTVKDNNGCTKTTQAIVGLTNTLILTGRTDTSICKGDSARLTTISNAATLAWTPTNDLSNPNIASPVAKPATTTTYTLTAQLGVCIKTYSVKITVNPLPIVDAGPDVVIIAGDITILQGSTNTGTYLWSPATGLNSTTIANPTAKPDTTTRYTLSTVNSFNCKASDDVLITVLPYCVKPRGAFTPNGDGNYDTWYVTDGTACLLNIEAHVYNRYGNKVFESKHYTNDWKGTYNGKSLPVGTYYYVLRFTLINGKVVDQKGNVTILR